MAKALITTRFPSTAAVARKLGVPASRIRRIAALMGLSAPKAVRTKSGDTRNTAKRAGPAKNSQPKRRSR